MIIKTIKNKKGVTLIELLVAVTLFSVVILSATQISEMVIKGQRNAIAAQNIQESLRYSLEFLSRQARMAIKDTSGQCGTINSVYTTTTGNDLFFLRNDGECIRYYLQDDRFKVDLGVSSSAFITSNEIKINNLVFSVVDNIGIEQSQTTMMIDLEAVSDKINKQHMNIQTTISSRYYE